MTDNLDDAKDRLIDRVEELLTDLLTDTCGDAEERGVGADLDRAERQEATEIDELLEAIDTLRHRELIEGVIQKVKGRKAGV